MRKQWTKRFQHGAICGKFWPLHMGHANLIQTAIDNCEQVDVFVIYQPEQEPGGFERALWIAKAFPVFVWSVPDLPHFEDDRDWAEAFAVQTTPLAGSPVDAVFSSEDYGDLWAAAIGAASVTVDPDRVKYPISGREIRRDPLAALDWIHPVARQYYENRQEKIVESEPSIAGGFVQIGT